MTAGPADDRVRVTIAVDVPVEVAFDVFTRETELWWRRGPRYRNAGDAPGTLAFEPRAGGRLFEEYASAAGRQVHVIGTITTWAPPHRLAFTWRARNFAPGEVTEVAVEFAPTRRGTRVTVEHRGWATIRADHPARHGQAAAAFLANLGRWWGDLLRPLQDRGPGPHFPK
ncbi:MAG: SRPBCC domain-containing protein [Kofleriaceae bacterium]